MSKHIQTNRNISIIVIVFHERLAVNTIKLKNFSYYLPPAQSVGVLTTGQFELSIPGQEGSQAVLVAEALTVLADFQ